MTVVVVLAFGVMIVVSGIVGLVSPARLWGAFSRWRPEVLLGLAVALRLIFGTAAIAAAPTSRFPEGMFWVGIAALLAAIALLAMGSQRLRRLVQWWMARPPALMRVTSGLAIMIGGLLVYAVV